MAVVNPIRVDTPTAATITWTAVGTADTGAAANVGDLGEIKCIHVVGAGTAQTRRSNDGTNFVANGAALAANTVTDQTTACKFIDISAVATAVVTVIMTAKKVVIKG